jgi:hypothetical protein
MRATALLVTSAQANETVCVVCANRLQKRGSSLVGEQLSTLHHDADMLAAISFVLQHCDELSSIDLHGLRASSAVMVAEWCTLHAAKQGLAVFTIITGRGSHSKGGSVLKPAVYSFCCNWHHTVVCEARWFHHRHTVQQVNVHNTNCQKVTFVVLRASSCCENSL